MTDVQSQVGSVSELKNPARGFRGVWYIAEHMLRAMRGYGFTIVILSIGNPLLYLFGLGLGLAAMVDHGTGVNEILGISFLSYVAPALLATSGVMVMVEECSFTVFSGFKWRPIYSGMNASPISAKQIAYGHLFAALIRTTATVIVYYLIILLFEQPQSAFSPLMVVTSILGGFAVGALVMAYVATLENDTGQITTIMRFVITPMFLFSGTFFPLTQMPIFLQWLGWISPLWHANEIGRVLSFGYDEPVWLSVVHLVVLFVLSVGGAMLCGRVFERRLNR